MKKDNGKNLNISYNVLNLPQKVWNTLDETDYLKIDYTFAGEKIRKREYENDTIKEDRFYLGGVEFVNSIAETYSHPEGRIQIVQTPGEPFKYAFQYKISDHLGNMAVFFEDSDSDGIIATEDSDPANSEVLQRHFYYSFGMEMQGAWVQPTAPENQYQYNGKEMNENLGLDWYEYGARMYDAAIGRFTGVDPIADQYAFVTVYNYAENEPIGHIDLWGLQQATADFSGAKLEKSEYNDNPLTYPRTFGNNVGISIYNSAIDVGETLVNFSIPYNIYTQGEAAKETATGMLASASSLAQWAVFTPDFEKYNTYMSLASDVHFWEDVTGIGLTSLAGGQLGFATKGYAGLKLQVTGPFLSAESVTAVGIEYWIQGTYKSTLNTMMKGRYAVESVPGDATRNFNTIRSELNSIGQKYGCHTCGTKTANGVYIPDHQPSLKLNPNGPFELFPHCPSCSKLQGGQVNKALNH